MAKGTVNVPGASSWRLKKVDETVKNLPRGSAFHIATIGTEWESDAETGVKFQTVAVKDMTAEMNALVGAVNTHERTSDGYALYVEEHNQFLEFITNGYAETVEGGIVFCIFGDANTINIPILVEVN